MKPSEQHLSEVCRQHNEALVARHVHELFKRLPMPPGFWLRPDLKVPELSVGAPLPADGSNDRSMSQTRGNYQNNQSLVQINVGSAGWRSL